MGGKSVFVDRALVRVIAGSGGNGSSHFHREKFVPLGGPDGGDGGRGGSVIFKSDNNFKTLIDFSYKREFQADSGKAGAGKKKYGRQGKDFVVTVPVGTIILTSAGEILVDLNESGQQFVVAKGGRGGRGNVHFATALRRAPKLSEKGEPGEERELILELKVLADVGIIGLPNAGKSTLLAALSAARPKIANYPFTTLSPNLGQVRIGEGSSFAMVDIPGLIEGASQGQGLGHEFLRHVERTKLLIHLLDVGFPGVDPQKAFDTINQELVLYNPPLAKKPQIVALNKVDLVTDPAVLEKIIAKFKKAGFEVFTLSAATRRGIHELAQKAYETLKRIPSQPLMGIKTIKKISGPAPRFVLAPIEPSRWRVTGHEVEKWVAMTDFDNEEAVDKLKNIFDRIGLTDAFKKNKLENGDMVVVGKEEFTFQKDKL